MTKDIRSRLASMIQAEHEDSCWDYDCKCHDRAWNTDLQAYVSAVALKEAGELIAEIEDAAVRRYRGVE